MSRRSLLALAVLAHVLLAASPASAAGAADRLDRFRALAVTRLSLAEAGDPERAADTYRELYALLDEEIVESLAGGGVFAAPAFLQDRLDGFAEAWGGASLRLVRVANLTVGAFHLGDAPGGSSVRIYGSPREEPQLIAAFHRDGRPTVHPVPSRAGATFLVLWEGVATGRGSRALRLELVRHRDEDVRVTWSSVALFPEGLAARHWHVRGTEVRVRYELRYPGWIPGCEPQTEQEDVLRLTAEADGFARVVRRQHNAWHLALHRAVEDLLGAMAGGHGPALAVLVPDPQLRQKLPSRLERETACDAPDGPEPAAVSVAASAGNHAPWALTFRRSGGRWRLTAATPVLH
ncbi:MAG: hypothetical protein ACREJ9_06565 [Candidatus Rokuibacteriota bacterium]